MANEDIEIRITRSGEIYVMVNGVSEERVRNYREFLEEMIGPISSEQIVSPPDWDRPSELASESEEERRRREQQLEH